MCDALSAPTGVAIGSFGYVFAMVLLVFTPLYLVATCVLFYRFRQSSMLLRKRRFSTVLITCFQVLSLLAYTAVYDVVGADHFPCILLALTFNVFSAVQAIAVVIKFTSFISTEMALEIGKQIELERNQRESRTPRTSTLSAFMPYYVPPKATFGNFQVYLKSVFLRDKSKLTLEGRIKVLAFMKSWTYSFMFGPPVLMIALITMGVRIAVDPDMRNNCTGCRVYAFEAIVQLVLTSWGMILAHIVLPNQALAHDTLRIMSEVKETLGLPGVIPWLLGLIMYLANGENTEFNWLTLCLICCLIMLFNHTWKLVFISWRLKREMFKTKRNLPACFAETYADPYLKHALQRLLDSEMSSEVYWFIDSVTYFKRTFEEDSAKSKELMTFYMENYILEGSPYEVNISGPTRERCVEYFKEKRMFKEMFDLAMEEVKNGFLTDGFLRFLVKKDQNKLDLRGAGTHVVAPTIE